MAGDRNPAVAVDQSRDEEPETEEDVRRTAQPFPLDPADDDLWGNISLGDQYDVRDTEGYWCEAEVLKIDLEKRRIFVAFLYWDNKWDNWISESDNKIAPLHRHTYIEGGRLQVGQRIEAFDKTNKWLSAFVIELSEERDEAKVHYKGWHVKFDEWLDRRGTRIRPYGRNKPAVQRRRREQKLWRVPGTSCSDQSNQVNINSGTSSSSMKTEQHFAISNNDLVKVNREQHKTFAGNSPEDVEHRRQISEMSERYSHYIGALNAQPIPLKVVSVPGDGNCLFRSVAHQVYGDYELHNLVRQRCMDYMEADAGFYSQFVEGGMEAFPFYLRAKRLNACWGDDPEIQSICELYNRPAEIWAYDTQRGARKLRTFHEATGLLSAQLPLRLSYYGGGHYDSIVDAKHCDQLLLSVPGEAETLALSRITERVAFESSMSTSMSTSTSTLPFEIIARVNGSQASEEEALDLAVQMSRNDNNRFCWQDDLETCLSMSLEESYLKNGKVSRNSNIDSTGNVEIQEGNNESSASLNNTSENNAIKGMGADTSTFPSPSSSSSSSHINNDIIDNNATIIAMQGETLRTAVEESERDFIEQAMLSSLQDETQIADDEILRQVRLQSLIESESQTTRGADSMYDYNDDVGISEALKASLYDNTSPSCDLNSRREEGKGIGLHSNIDVPVDVDVDLILKLSELSEEEALQLAIKESTASAAIFSSSSTSLHSNIYQYGSYGLQSPRSPHTGVGIRGTHTGLEPMILGPIQSGSNTGTGQKLDLGLDLIGGNQNIIQDCNQGQDQSKSESKSESESLMLQDVMRLFMKSVTSSSSSSSSSSSAIINSTSNHDANLHETGANNSDGGGNGNADRGGCGVVETDKGNSKPVSVDEKNDGNIINTTESDEEEERELQRAIAESLR